MLMNYRGSGPDKVGRTHVSFKRYAVAEFGSPAPYLGDVEDVPGIRPITQILSCYESRKDAEWHVAELRGYENWQNLVVLDLAEVDFAALCLSAERIAQDEGVNVRYDKSRAAQAIGDALNLLSAP